MAASKTPNQSADDLVEDWMQGPSDGAGQCLIGFALGRAEDDAFYRLYLDSSLSRYVDVAKADTLHARKLDEKRTAVWIKPGANVRQVNARNVPIEFLQGQLRRGFLRGSQGPIGNVLMAMECPSSGCGHCTTSCSHLPGGGGTTVEFTCDC